MPVSQHGALNLTDVRRWLFSFVTLLSCATTSALACETVCVTPENIESLSRQAERVLVGRVVRVSEDNGASRFSLEVIRSWKGGGRSLELSTHGGGASCGKQLEHGRVYVAFLSKGEEEIHICSLVGGVWEDWAKRAITRLARMRRFPPLSLPAVDLRAPRART
jgi:hypothetical protein